MIKFAYFGFIFLNSCSKLARRPKEIQNLSDTTYGAIFIFTLSWDKTWSILHSFLAQYYTIAIPKLYHGVALHHHHLPMIHHPHLNYTIPCPGLHHPNPGYMIPTPSYTIAAPDYTIIALSLGKLEDLLSRLLSKFWPPPTLQFSLKIKCYNDIVAPKPYVAEEVGFGPRAKYIYV